jgi:serine/threonine protein phosphatase PrpC
MFEEFRRAWKSRQRGARFRSPQWEWIPSSSLSRQIPLAFSAAVNRVDTPVLFEPTTPFPHLRLPQKPIAGSRSTRPLQAIEERQALADIPTRPAPRSHQSSHPIAATFPLQVGVGWHPGITRRHVPNEDGIVTLQGMCTHQHRLVPFGLFVVADGMGGQEGGWEAARIATRSMMHTVLQTIMMGDDLTDEYLVDILSGGVEWANMAVHQRGRELKQDMGTTLTAALVVGMKAYLVNVGDSRAYLHRAEVGLTQITQDHSLVASLVTRGQIAPEEIYTHPDRNQIYRNIGQHSTVKVDWFVVELSPGDRLLLCSDGLWEMVRDPTIARALSSSNDPVVVSDRLIQTALRGGGIDNISSIVAFVP